MKLLELLDRGKFKRGLEKSKSLRAIKDKQFKPKEEKLAKEVQG